jgi:hypothetical protein
MRGDLVRCRASLARFKPNADPPALEVERTTILFAPVELAELVAMSTIRYVGSALDMARGGALGSRGWR